MFIAPLKVYFDDTKTKKKCFEKYGVKEYWIVDPQDNEIIGYKLIETKFVYFKNCIGTIESELLNLKIVL